MGEPSHTPPGRHAAGSSGADKPAPLPKRIQMTRKKGGWRKDHPDAVIVARPTKWGNPYSVGADGKSRADVVAIYEEWIRGDSIGARITRFRAMVELRGKDLACWCPLDEPCHADLLLEIANG